MRSWLLKKQAEAGASGAPVPKLELGERANERFRTGVSKSKRKAAHCHAWRATGFHPVLFVDYRQKAAVDYRG